MVKGQLSSNQTINNGTDTVVQFIDDFDPTGWLASNKFQPTIAGYYSLDVSINWAAGAITTNQCNIQFRKNGTTQVAIWQLPIQTASAYNLVGSEILYFNGTTDYIEVTAYTGNTTNQVINSNAGTYFCAALYAYGPQGYTGSAGTNGTNGYTGSAGTNGTNGYTGSAGPVAGSNTQVIFNDSGVAAGNANLTFNKTTSTLDVNGIILAGTGSALGGLTNPLIEADGNVNNYIQTSIYNANNGNSASADFIAYPNNGTDASGWIDLGITSNSFSQAAYSVTSQNEGYVFMSAPSGSGRSGNLVIATDSTGTSNSIEFYVGGFTQAKGAAKFVVNSAGAAVNGISVGYLNIPQVSLASNTSITTGDAGKHYYSTSASNLTLTVANNTSQAFSIGSAISVVNQGTGTITIALGSGVTMYMAGNSTSSARSLSSYGMATIMKVATDTWFINGTGVS